MDREVGQHAIALDVSARLNTVSREISELLKRVRIGLAAELPEAGRPLSFRDLAFELTMAQWDEEAPSAEELGDFTTWVLANGFRELIERVHVHLDWAGSFCHALERIEEFGLDAIASNEAGTHIEEVDRYWARSHKMGFRRKMECLRKRYSVATNLDDVLVRFQQVRNCLTHRGGIVSAEMDCADGQLLSLWAGIDIDRFGSAEGPKPIERPEDVGCGGLYMFDGCIRSRGFKPGDRVQIGVRDFNEIAVTTYFYCREVTKAAVEFGHSRSELEGLLPELGEDWAKATAMHLHLRTPRDGSAQREVVVVDWRDRRLRPLGVRRFTEGVTGAVPE